MEVDEHIFEVPGDMLKWTIPFPVHKETGNGIMFDSSWKQIGKTRKLKLLSIFFLVPGDMSKWQIPFPFCQETGNLYYFDLFLKENS